MHRFGNCPRRVGSAAFRFGVAARRVGLRAHCFRFSACTDSEIALGGLAFGLTASAFRYAPLWRLPSAVGLRTHRFRFSARTASEWPLGGLAFGLTASAFRHAPLRRLPLGELVFGLTVSAFRHAPLRSCRSAGWCFRWAGWPSSSLLLLFGMYRFGVAAGRVGSSAFRFGDSARRVGLRAHCFRFSARTASEWPLGELALPPSVSEIAARWVGSSAFRFGDCRSASWFFCLPFRRLPLGGWPSGSPLPLFGMHRFGDCRWAGWPSGSRLPLFGMRRFGVAAGRVGLRVHGFRFSARADPHRRTAEARTD